MHLHRRHPNPEAPADQAPGHGCVTARRWLDFAVLIALVLASWPAPARAQQTVGLFLNDTALASPGYTLFSPMRYTTTYLIDMQGRLVHAWPATLTPGLAAYLYEDGHLLRTANTGSTAFATGGSGGRVQEFDWNGAIVWDYTYSTSDVRQHHDIERLPNGDVLMIAWELKTTALATAAGRNPALVTASGLWLDQLVQVRPTGPTTGAIVWEWHAWEHLVQDFDAAKANFGVVSEHPERLDFNFTQNSAPDWTHANGIHYDPLHDEIVLSAHNFNEIWVIDHSTTTAEAAGHAGGLQGHGGDLLYRWGNPRAYGRGVTADQRLFGQHDAQWIRDGLPGARHLLVFNNGVTRGWSSVEEIASPVDATGAYPALGAGAHGPASASWTYTDSPLTDFYAQNIGGAERLPNGNTLVCNGPTGVLFEVTPAGQEVWRYVNPVVSAGPMTQGDVIPSGTSGQQNTVFRASRYAADFAGFAGRDLSPQGTIEVGGLVGVGALPPVTPHVTFAPPRPNPSHGRFIASFTLPHADPAEILLFDLQGRLVRRLDGGVRATGHHDTSFDLSGLANGIYLVAVRTPGETVVRRIVKLD